MKTLFNDHLHLFQDFNQFECSFLVSHSNDDEHNWIVGLRLLFWGMEFSWNSRKKKDVKGIDAKQFFESLDVGDGEILNELYK